jgi:hypothetical protein
VHKGAFHGFDGRADVLEQFSAPKNALRGARIYIASYEEGSYEGDAFVLFERDGKLYEVNGSHCSCMGLEGQWKPEETSWEALAHIMRVGTKFVGTPGAERSGGARLKRLIDARVPI